MINCCNICPRHCNVDRSNTSGICRSHDALRIASFGLHRWEEPPISGTRGSGTIFFSGCNLGCIYCQNKVLSRDLLGIDITPYQLSEIMRSLCGQGAHNINLVTPSHYVDKIKKSLDIYRPNIPICYNTSSYDCSNTINSLLGYIDIYLADLKYMDAMLAHTLSNADDYPVVATAAITEMRRQVPDIFDEYGIMQQGLIIRHLVLPNCLQNTFDCIDYISDHYGKDTVLSIMNQYTPCGDNLPQFLHRPLKPIEYKLAVSHAAQLNMNNCYIQDAASASPDYIPPFESDIIQLKQFLITLDRD